MRIPDSETLPDLPGPFLYRRREDGSIEVVAPGSGPLVDFFDSLDLMNPGKAMSDTSRRDLQRSMRRIEAARLRSEVDAGTLRIVR